MGRWACYFGGPRWRVRWGSLGFGEGDRWGLNPWLESGSLGCCCRRKCISNHMGRRRCRAMGGGLACPSRFGTVAGFWRRWGLRRRGGRGGGGSRGVGGAWRRVAHLGEWDLKRRMMKSEGKIKHEVLCRVVLLESEKSREEETEEKVECETEIKESIGWVWLLRNSQIPLRCHTTNLIHILATTKWLAT